MRIAYLASGAAGMYCGTCLHDNTLAAALLKAGEDVLLIPTYTPLRTDEEDVSQRRVFFGGINVYLQQKSPVFRHTPWCLDNLLDARWMKPQQRARTFRNARRYLEALHNDLPAQARGPWELVAQLLNELEGQEADRG